jgi:hypothetical protein
MKWITREHPKIDRIACPWGNQAFYWSEAEIIYVPFEQMIANTIEIDAVAFDLPGIEYDYLKFKHLLK